MPKVTQASYDEQKQAIHNIMTQDCLLCQKERYLHFPLFRIIDKDNLWQAILTHQIEMPVTNCRCHICGVDIQQHIENDGVRLYSEAVSQYKDREEYLNLIILSARKDIIFRHGFSEQDKWLRLYQIPELMSGDYDKAWLEYYSLKHPRNDYHSAFRKASLHTNMGGLNG